MYELTGIKYLAAIILWSMLLGEIITIALATMVITVGTIFWANLPSVFIGSCVVSFPFAWGGCRQRIMDRKRDDEKEWFDTEAGA